MLYESPKTKKYILIGAGAVVLAVLIVAIIPFFFRDKTTQVPTNLPLAAEQQKIQKDMQEAAKRLKDQPISEQQIKEDMKSASQELKKLPAPSQEDMQKAAKELN